MAEVITQSNVTKWTTSEEANEHIKKITEEVKLKREAESILNRKFEKFEATQFRTGTPGGTGIVMYAVKVDIGDGKFIHLMISSEGIQKPTPKLERCALFFQKDSPLETF